MKVRQKILPLLAGVLAVGVLGLLVLNWQSESLPYGISGQIFSHETHPIDGARIEVFAVTNGQTALASRAVGGADGLFQAFVRGDGAYLLVASADGFVSASRSVQLSRSNRKAQVVFHLGRVERDEAAEEAAGFRRLAGKVTDAQSNPVRAAKLRLYGFDPANVEFVPLSFRQRTSRQNRSSVSADDAGLYEILISPAVLRRQPFTIVHCSAPGYATATANPAADTTELDFVLSKGILVAAGWVVNSFDNKPIADALVRFFVTSTNQELVAYTETVSGPNGAFVLGDLPLAEEVAYLATAKGYTRASGNLNTRDKRKVEQVIVLQPGGKLIGIVMNARDHRPIVGATVHSAGQAAAVSTQSQENGQFLLEGVPLGEPVRLVAEADGFARTTLDESAGIVAGSEESTNRVEILLQPAVKISGRVTNENGEPVADALVKLQGQADQTAVADDFEQTSETGEFKFAAVASAAKCTITAEHPSYDSASRNFVTPQAGEIKVSLVVSNGGGLAGQVLYDDGTPAAGFTVRSAFVEKIGDDGVVVFGNQKQAESDKAGRYAIRGLKPGRYLVSLFDSQNSNLSEQECVILNRVVHQMDFRIPRPGAVAGAILDSQGSPYVAGCKLWLASQESDYSAQQEIKPGISEYAFADLQPGEYQISAKGTGAGDFGPVTVLVHSGKITPQDIKFPEELFLQGVVRATANGSPVAGAQVEIFTIDANERPMNPGRPSGNFTGGVVVTDGQGAFKVGGISRGYYKLSVTHPQFMRHGEDMDFRETAPATPKEILLSKGSILTASISDEADNPHTGATVVLGSRPSHERYLADTISQNGIARFEYVPPGAYELWVIFKSADGTPKRVDVPIELSDREQKQLRVKEPKD